MRCVIVGRVSGVERRRAEKFWKNFEIWDMVSALVGELKDHLSSQMYSYMLTVEFNS